MAKDRQTIWRKSLFHTERQSCSIAECVGLGQELLAPSKPAVFILGGILLQFWMYLSVIILVYQTFLIMFYATNQACGRLGTLVTGQEWFLSRSRSAELSDSAAGMREVRDGQTALQLHLPNAGRARNPLLETSSPIWPQKGNKVDENIHVSITGQPALFQYK